MPHTTRRGSVRAVSQNTWAAETDAKATKGLDVVYYLRLPDGLIKIGTTNRPLTRIAEHGRKSGSTDVLAVEFGGRALERERHVQFAADRVDRHEHFNPSPALMAHISSLREALHLTA